MGAPTFTKPFIDWLDRRCAKKLIALQRLIEQRPAILDRISIQDEPVGAESTLAQVFEDTSRLSSGDAVVTENRVSVDVQENAHGDSETFIDSAAGDESNIPQPRAGPMDPVTGAIPEHEAVDEGYGTTENQVASIPTAGNGVSEGGSAPTETTSSQPTVRPISRVSAENSSSDQTEQEPEPVVKVVKVPTSRQVTPREPKADGDSVQESLREIFRKKTVTTPYVKNLLKKHGTVDARALADELREFARQIGAVGPDQNAQ